MTEKPTDKVESAIQKAQNWVQLNFTLPLTQRDRELSAMVCKRLLASGEFIAKSDRQLSCTLCKEGVRINELERHYLTYHVGTYSPFAWIEQFVLLSQLDAVGKKTE